MRERTIGCTLSGNTIGWLRSKTGYTTNGSYICRLLCSDEYLSCVCDLSTLFVNLTHCYHRHHHHHTNVYLRWTVKDSALLFCVINSLARTECYCLPYCARYLQSSHRVSQAWLPSYFEVYRILLPVISEFLYLLFKNSSKSNLTAKRLIVEILWSLIQSSRLLLSMI